MFRPTSQIMVVLAMSSILHEVSGGYEHWCTPGMVPTGNCGPNLDEMLTFYCGANGYNFQDFSYGRRKRDTDREIKMELKDIRIKEKDAKRYLSKRTNYYYQGIVCECCIHPCSTDELMSYCSA